MAHFSVYNTDSTVSGSGTGDQNNGASPFPSIKANSELKLQPIQMDFAEYVSGSIESEKPGTLFIEQSSDYPQNHENEESSIEKAHWVPVESKRGGEELKGGIIVGAKEPVTFLVFAGAPYLRLRWKQEKETTKEKEEVEKKEKANSDNLSLRLFARAQEKGRV